MAELKSSQRFSRAARAERDRLRRQRISVTQRRDDLQVRVDELESELATIDERLGLLDTLAGASEEPSNTSGYVEAVGEIPLKVVRGATIRDLALPILMRAGRSGPIHYREWYRLFNDAGYVAAGKRPDAVFLNQVSRSPLVKSTTKSGYYVLDTNVIAALREQLRDQQSKLSDLLETVPKDEAALARRHEQQRVLTAGIAKTERDLREAMRTLDEAQGEGEAWSDELPDAKAA